MLQRLIYSLLFATSVFAMPSQAIAQTWSAEQQDVWAVVVESWADIVAKDIEWTDRWVHPNAVGWNIQNPMPRSRETIKEWDRYDFDGATTMVSDFAPTAIVVQDTTAIAHYYYSLGTVDSDGERETVHGRCTDILVSDGEHWQFIGWNCGDMETDE
jgi:hypothetical protein